VVAIAYLVCSPLGYSTEREKDIRTGGWCHHLVRGRKHTSLDTAGCFRETLKSHAILLPLFSITKRNVMVYALSCLWDEIGKDTNNVDIVDKKSRERAQFSGN
jgi:hypothetical protein